MTEEIRNWPIDGLKEVQEEDTLIEGILGRQQQLVPLSTVRHTTDTQEINITSHCELTAKCRRFIALVHLWMSSSDVTH